MYPASRPKENFSPSPDEGYGSMGYGGGWRSTGYIGGGGLAIDSSQGYMTSSAYV